MLAFRCDGGEPAEWARGWGVIFTCAGTGAEENLEQTKENLEHAHAYQKTYFDCSHRHDEFEVSNSVLLSTKNLHLTGSHKLQQCFTGPFQVI